MIWAAIETSTSVNISKSYAFLLLFIYILDCFSHLWIKSLQANHTLIPQEKVWLIFKAQDCH